MPAVTKTPRTSLRFTGRTPPRILNDARKRYRDYVVDVPEALDDPYEDFFETDFAKRMEAKLTPALALSTLRGAHGWSQARLAAEIGGVSAKRISDWETGRRAISKEYAKKLAKIFRFPADKFI